MFRIKKHSVLLALFLLCTIFFTVSAMAAEPWSDVKQRGVLRCGAAVAPAYVMKNQHNGTYSGFFVALCRQFAKKLGVKAKFIDTNWDNLVAGVQSNRWDLAMALNKTPERARAVNFSAPVQHYHVSFLYSIKDKKIPKDLTLDKINKPDFKVTSMSGTVQDKTAKKALPNARMMPLPSDDAARLAITSGRADFLADANISNMVFKAAHPDWARIFDPKKELASQGVGFGVSKSRSKADLEVLDKFIEARHKSGEIKKLIKKASQEAVDFKSK